VPHDGIWIGPQQTILVEIGFIPALDQPKSPGKVVVLKDNLEAVQEIETQSNSTTREYGSFTHYGIRFMGVTADHRAVLFSEEAEQKSKEKCLVYTGIPLKQTGECAQGDLASIKLLFHNPGRFNIPSGHEERGDSPGTSSDGSIASIFVTKRENGLCQLAGTFCPSHGKLTVFETQSKRILFSRTFSVDASLALSPDGRHVAAFTKDKLEILAVP
jgi:hypothetical protein